MNMPLSQQMQILRDKANKCRLKAKYSKSNKQKTKLYNIAIELENKSRSVK